MRRYILSLCCGSLSLYNVNSHRTETWGFLQVDVDIGKTKALILFALILWTGNRRSGGYKNMSLNITFFFMPTWTLTENNRKGPLLTLLDLDHEKNWFWNFFYIVELMMLTQKVRISPNVGMWRCIPWEERQHHVLTEQTLSGTLYVMNLRRWHIRSHRMQKSSRRWQVITVWMWQKMCCHCVSRSRGIRER